MTCFVFTSISLSGSVFAASETIEWQDSQIHPGKKISINFDKLVIDVKYNLKCSLASNDVMHKGKDDIKVITNGKAQVFVNGIDTESNNGYVTIMYPLNTLRAANITKDSIISIYNLDPFDVINIHRCTAISA